VYVSVLLVLLMGLHVYNMVRAIWLNFDKFLICCVLAAEGPPGIPVLADLPVVG